VELVLSAGSQGVFDGLAIPVVGDHSNAGNFIVGTSTDSKTLGDLFGNGYRLRRICGHIWPHLNQVAAGGLNYIVTIGFQVMSVGEAGLPANSEEAVLDSYATQDNPWIWRRSWLLTNYLNPDVGAGEQTMGLSGPAQGGMSIREGSFIDQKTARTVGVDQRLFMCIQATCLGAASQGGILTVHWNYRTLGSLLTTAPGNRRNSTR